MAALVSFVGFSGSGKTTLLEKIIALLKQKGYRVGVIKHDAHRFDIDHEGKDSYRLAQAGADSVALVSAEKIALVKKNSPSDPQTELDALAAWLMPEAEIVLTEGYKKSAWPKIEVTADGRLCCAADPMLWAVVYNPRPEAALPESLANFPLPVFRLDEASRLAEFILQKINVKRR